ncbi:MAG TPA: DUF134 domain-containing protein [Patescibacteria group bacterium]|nr:DUF134 domain-containing protein [Patescibacteria group bacterium]
MPRRRCCGLIEDVPVCLGFHPQRRSELEPVALQLEELEAIRLKDHTSLAQAECAEFMGLTRPTFQRVLQSARSKIALALVEGRAIIIKGGNYMVKNRTFECSECGKIWEVEPCSEGGKHGYEIACPKCGSLKKSKLENGVKHACAGGHSGHGGGCCGGH